MSGDRYPYEILQMSGHTLIVECEPISRYSAGFAYLHLLTSFPPCLARCVD